MTEQIQNTTIKVEKHTKIMIIIFLFISIPLFYYSVTLHKEYKSSDTVIAKITGITVNQNSDIQIKYEYRYDNQKYKSECIKHAEQVNNIKVGEKREIRISTKAPSDVMPYVKEIDAIFPFASTAFVFVAFAILLWYLYVKK